MMRRAGRKGLTCILWVLAIFLVTYMGLVFTYRVDGYAVMIVGVIFGVLGMLLFVASAKAGGNRTRNYCGIFSELRNISVVSDCIWLQDDTYT